MSVRAERVIRERVMIRDNYRCQRPGCGKPATDAGHIIARSQGGAYTEDNLQAECTTHNRSEGWDLGHQTTSTGTGDDNPETGGARMSTTATEVSPAETAESTTTAEQATTEDPKGGKPAEEAGDDWKAKAREWEKRAKENHAAAAELAKIKKANQTEAERIAEEAANARKEADEAKAETARWKSAATHHVSEDYFDLLGTGTPEEIASRAERVGKLEAAAKELAALKAQLAAQEDPTQQTTTKQTNAVTSLKPGAQVTPDDSYPAAWFPQMRPVDSTNQ
jgi:hypothetical protein